MADRDYPLAAAMHVVSEGMSARSGLRAFRAGGGRVQDSTWFRIVAEVRRAVAERLDEAQRPLNRRPRGDEISVMTTQRRTGFWQEVQIFARSKETGEVYATPFVLRGQGLLTRQAVIDFALAEWEAGSSGTPNPDDDQVLGAAYVQTLELSPETP